MTLTPWALEVYLKLNHMTQSIVEMIFELWQSWFCDHICKEPAPGNDHSLSEESIPDVPNE